MVHQLLKQTQIRIRDQEGPFRLSLSAKKPFEKVRQIRGADSGSGPVFIVYDRYRFEVVEVPLEHGRKGKVTRSNSRPRSRSLRRENSLNPRGEELPAKAKTGLEALQALRQAGKMLHCTFSESRQQLVMLMADKTMATFEFASERLVTGLRTPSAVLGVTSDAWNKLGSQVGSLANKFSKGAKLYDMVKNTAGLDFEIFQPTTKAETDAQEATRDCKGEESVPIVFCSRAAGQQLIQNDTVIQMVQPGCIANSFAINKEHNLNVSTEIRLQRIKGKSRTVEISYRCAVFQLERPAQISGRVPFLVKEEIASFSIQLTSKEECQKLAAAYKNKEPIDTVLKAKIQTCAKSLTSLVVIETEGGSSFIFMIDAFKKQTVIDLSKRMHGDIPSLNAIGVHVHTNNRVKDMQWVELAHQKYIAIMTLENNAVACFDHDGQQVKLLSDAIFSQNIIGNFDHFAHRSGLRLNNALMWVLHEDCLSLFDGTSFQTFQADFSLCLFQKPIQVTADLRRCQRVGRGYPMITVSDEVVLDSKLFEKNQRVFWHFFLACRLYEAEKGRENDILVYRTIFQGFNTVVFFLKYQEYVLALKSLECLKTHVMDGLYCAQGERTHSGKRFLAMKKYKKIQVINNDKVLAYILPDEQPADLFNKAPILRQLAALIVVKLVQAKSERQTQIKQKLESQKGILMPEQITYEQRFLVQCFKIVKRIMRVFFKNKKSIELYGSVASSLDCLQAEKEKRAKMQRSKLAILQRVAHGRLPTLKSGGQNEPGLGRYILMLLIQSQKAAQGRLGETSDIDNFKKAVEIFKECGLMTPANEFLLMLQLLRKIQMSLNTGPKLKKGNVTHLFRTELPNPLETTLRMKGNEIIDLVDFKQSSKVQAIRTSDAQFFGKSTLKSSFDLFFADSDQLISRALSDRTQTFDELLLLCQFFNEAKQTHRPTHLEPFRKLIQVFLSQNYGQQSALVSLKYMLDQTPGVIEPESNAFKDIRNSLFAQRRTKTNKYPKLITYLLQNVNKMPQKEFKQVKLPGIPLDPSKSNLNSFLCNSLVALCTAFKCDFSINMNALMNAPTIRHGILEAMNLQDTVHKSLLRNSKKIQIQNDGVDASKEAIWEVILWLWGIQCQFMAEVKQSNPLMKEQAKVWRIRSISITKTLHRDTQIDTSQLINMFDRRKTSREDIGDDDSNDSFHKQCKSDLEQIQSIYLDQHQLLQPLDLVQRALTDSHFSQFLLKIPTIFTHYSQKCLKQTVELQSRVKQRIQYLYWSRYCEFREAFGLKLNYSLKYERGINVIQLVKRKDRKTFKSEQAELSIKEIEDQLNLKENQDASFISDDPFNKSITSKESAFTLAHFQPTTQQPVSPDLNLAADKDQSGIQNLSAIENINDYTNDKLLLEDPRWGEASGSQQSVQNIQRSSLMVAFEDVQLRQRESAPLPNQDAIDNIDSKEVILDYQDAGEEPFVQTDLNFLSKQGRVLSPLEPSNAIDGGQNDSALDQSEADQLLGLKYQISLGKKQQQYRTLKKPLRLLERFFWKKQIQYKFGTLYQLRAYVEAKQQADRIAQLKTQMSVGSGSIKDDSTSMGQTATALSTQPTTENRGRGRGGRGGALDQGLFTEHATQRDDSPHTDKSTSISAAQYAMSHTQRLQRGQSSPKFFARGRGRSADRGSDFSREDDEVISKFKTITLHEDDDFYQAYLNRGRSSPLGFQDNSKQGRFQQRFEAFSSGRKFGQDDGQGTSNFDDSRYLGDESAPSMGGFTDATPRDNWYDRRNYFLDLPQYVKGLRSRVVRTPEMQERHKRQLDENEQRRRQGHSHSPLRASPQKKQKQEATKKQKKTGSILDRIKLMRVMHPSAMQPKISPMRTKSDILQFPVRQQYTQQQPGTALNIKRYNKKPTGLQHAVTVVNDPRVTQKQRRARLLQFHQNAQQQAQ